MSDINTPMDVIVCPQCSLPKLTGVYGYAGPQCQCWHPTPQPTLDIAGTLHQQSEEIRRLRAELAASRERFDKATAAFEREQDRALAAEVRAESAETALAASREREARMQWQPIETAPTDGARILLCGKGGKIADGYYGQPDGFANPKRFVWPYIHANPTHWMPLQAPPAALAEGAQE